MARLNTIDSALNMATNKKEISMNKLIYAGVAVITMGAVGTVFAVVMEITTNEPVWMLVAKITAGLFGVGGGLLGLASIIRRRR